MKIALLFVFATVVYADGIRQSSGQVGHSPSAGSHSRERVDGQYSAMPAGAASEVQGLAATGQVGAVVVMPGDVEEAGGAIAFKSHYGPIKKALVWISVFTVAQIGGLIFFFGFIWIDEIGCVFGCCACVLGVTLLFFSFWILDNHYNSLTDKIMCRKNYCIRPWIRSTLNASTD